MASRGNTPCWEAPTFSFAIQNQTEQWQTFYIHAISFLEALNIDIDPTDESKKGWKHLKMMFEGEDWLMSSLDFS